MTSTAQRNEPRRPTALDELRTAYQEQLKQLATERDQARRQARRAKAERDVARADLADLRTRVHDLLTAASRHLPGLPAPETPEPAPARPVASGARRPEPGRRPDRPDLDKHRGTATAGAERGEADKRRNPDRRSPRGGKRRAVRAG
ncbi:hypothetical protein [Actinomadura roseirufa]|uniref:hypothetical protein n=1 Tax=Actinomadura roseirufa TaxID=2094049 RepID=UPI001040EABA|nr:hypothetical protein [Actinomadura roseirufa]